MSKFTSPITVMRIGYRVGRDPRINTHLGLVARALGAKEFLVSGDRNDKMFETINQVTRTFGGKFTTKHIESPINWIKNFKSEKFSNKKGVIVHLTMYGEDHRKICKKIPKDRPLAIIVGGAKVPASIYRIADYNVSVGSQPHSEVAALAILLDRLQDGDSVDQDFENPKLKIIPDLKSKKVIDYSRKVMDKEEE